MRIDRTKHNKFVTGAVYGNTTSGGITPSSSTASAVGGGGSTVIIQGGGGSQEPVKLGLGDLTNVGTWANEVATEDRFMVQVADGNQWVAKPISDIIYDESDLATYAKISYVNEKLADKVDNAFFLRIFGVIGENDEEIPVNDVSSTIKSIQAKFGLWTYDFLSAIGLNPTDGEITAISLASLNDVLLNQQLIEGQALVWNGDFWTNQSIKSGLDENSLQKYLYANKYVTQDYVTEQLLSYATIGELNQFKVETSKNLDNLQSEINDLDDKKLDKSFFKALFGLMDNDVEIEPNVKEIPESASIKAKFGLWTEEYLSALGMNPADGEVALTLSSLNDVQFTNLKEGQSVVWDGGKWVNQLIESGLNESALDIYLNENEYAKKSDIPVIPTTDINKGVTAYGWGDHSKVGYLTGITSKLVTDVLGYTPYDAANFTKANIKSTLGISDWALASSKPSYTTKEVAEDTNLYFTNARAVAALKSITDGLQSDIDTKLDASVFSELFEKVTLKGGVTAIRAKYGLFTDYFLSAKGANTNGGSSSGEGLITSLYRYADLGKTFSDTNNDTFNAYTINKINTDLGSRISVLEGKATNVSFTQSLTSGTQIGSISIDGASKNIYAPTIPTSDINKGVTAHGWGNHATMGYITASANITGNAASASLIKPTTGTGKASTWTSLTSYTRIWGESFNVSSLGSDTGDIALYLRSGVYTKNSAELCVAIDGDFYAQTGSKKVLHEGNYTDYAYSKTTIDSKFSGLGTFAYKSSLAFADLTNKPTTIGGYGITDAYTKTQVDSALGGYLPLSGGTLTSNNVALTIKRYTANPIIGFNGGAEDANERYGYLGFSGKDRPAYIDATGSAVYPIIHSGNIGSQSVSYASDADKLDGKHLTDIINYIENPTTAIDLNSYTANEGINIISYNNASSANVVNSPYSNATGVLSFGSRYTMQFATPYISNKLVFRSYYNGWYDWREVAFIDSNVASATKLQTARSIWGQSFDGSGNVSGALSGVTTLTASSSATIGSTLYMTGTGSQIDASIVFSRPQSYIVMPTNGGFNVAVDTPTAANTIVRFASSKNVLIGTTTDSGYKLDVNGSVAVGNSGDSVFYMRRGYYNRFVAPTSGGFFAWRVNGVAEDVMVLDTSGNVGIGTLSPTALLHLEKNGAYDVDLKLANTADNFRIVQHKSGDAYISLNGNHSLIYETGNTERMRIVGNGNVGIGTTSPSYKLHVNGDARANSIYGTNVYVSTGADGIYFSGSGIYYHNSSNSWVTDLIKFTSNGNVGIGTNNPQYKLDVNGTMYGDLKMKTPRTIWGQSFNGENDVNGHLSIGTIMGQVYANRAELSIVSETDVPCDLWLGNSGGNVWSINCRPSNENHSFSIYHGSLGHLFRIDGASGNVGIGTTSPQYNLHVKSVAPALMCESTASESSIYFSASLENAYRWAIGKGVWNIGGDFGIGEYNTARKLFFRIAKNGNVGIGLSYATAPSYKLHINGTLHASDAVSFGSTLDVTGAITKPTTSGGNMTSNYISAGGGYSSGTGKYGVKILCCDQADAQTGLGQDLSGLTGGYELSIVGGRSADNGYSYISFVTHAVNSTSYRRLGYFHDNKGAISFNVIGTIYSTTGIYSDGYVSAKGQNTSSDMRLKNVLNEVVLGVKDIANAPSIRFVWKNGGGVDVGSSAQYWQGLLPDAVKEQNSLLEMQYGNIALLSAIAIAKKVETHEERIARLERENKELRNEISMMKRGIYE